MTAARFFLKLDHDFATDPLFLRAADLVGATVELCQGVFMQLLTRASKNGDGSITNFDIDEVAWYYRKPVELIAAIVETYRRLRRLDGDALVNWAKRQGEKAVMAGKAIVADVGQAIRPPPPSGTSTPRVRATRRRQKDERAQLSLMLRVPGGRERSAPANDETSVAPVAPGVSPGVSSAENDNAPNAINDNALERERERKRESDSVFKNLKVVLGGRSAPLEGRDPEWLKQRRREALQGKLFRFAMATMTEEASAAALEGLGSSDPATAQRWLDRLDIEMRACGWDDKRASG